MAIEESRGLVEQYLDEIHTTWKEARSRWPEQDDLACVVVEHPDTVSINVGPRLDLVKKLDKQGKLTANIEPLRQAAGEVDPPVPLSWSIWVVAYVHPEVSIFRMIDKPMLMSKGGQA